MPALSPRALDSAWPSTMPASSTRWWVSTCTSPEPRKVMSNPPYRATCSSMWSRNASPVATLTLPRPSRATRAVSWVSLLFRTTSAVLLLKAHLDCMRVRAQAFELGEAHAGVAEHLEIAAVETQHAAALEERVHAQRRRKSRGSRRWQRVVGSGRVVAQRDRGICADEDRARVLDLCGQPSRILGHDQKMLGRKVVGDMHRLFEVVGHDHAASRGFDDLGSLQSAHQASQLLLDAIRERG